MTSDSEYSYTALTMLTAKASGLKGDTGEDFSVSAVPGSIMDSDITKFDD